jgi:addiction module RelE/StbE family toxin
MTRSRFEVRLTDQAQKDLKRLRPWTSQAASILLSLEDDPFRGHPLTGSLRGTRSLEFSLKGGGVYRAVYVVLEDERVCIVFIIGPTRLFTTKLSAARLRLDVPGKSDPALPNPASRPSPHCGEDAREYVPI